MSRTTEDRAISKCYSIRASVMELLAAEVRRRGAAGVRATDSQLVNEAIQIAFGGAQAPAQRPQTPSPVVPAHPYPTRRQTAPTAPQSPTTLPWVNPDGNTGLPPGVSEEVYKAAAFRPDRSETERLANLERSRAEGQAALFAEPIALYTIAKRTQLPEDWEAAYQCARTIHGPVRAAIIAAQNGQPGFELPKAPTLEENLRQRQQFYRDNPDAFTAEDVLAKIRAIQAADDKNDAKNARAFEMRDNAIEGEHPEVTARAYDPKEFAEKDY